MAQQSLVFISYSRKDVHQAHQITEILERGGHRPWIDNQLVPGQKWREKIEQAINNADAFLIVLSPDSLTSEYCQWEYALAVQQSKPIFPVVVETLPEQFPEQMADIADIQFVDMSEGIDVTNTAALIGGVFQARPVTQTKIPILPKAPDKPPVEYSQDASPTSKKYSLQSEVFGSTEPITQLPLPNQDILPRGVHAKLTVVTSPTLDSASLPIHTTNYTIGRAPTMSLNVPEKRISKHHLTLYWANSKFFIVDYSLNGTWLNGEYLENNRPMRLRADVNHRIDLARNNTVLNFQYRVDES